LDPKEWSESVRAVVGGGGGGKGNTFTGTGPDVANVKLAVDVARKLLEQRLG
jgi:alanyl-tRNA synthetase